MLAGGLGAALGDHAGYPRGLPVDRDDRRARPTAVCNPSNGRRHGHQAGCGDSDALHGPRFSRLTGGLRVGFADSSDRRLLVLSGDGSYHDEEQPPRWAFAGPSAAVRARTVMTAFDEPMQAAGKAAPPVGTRYGYAGSRGYEEAECRVIDLNGPEPGGETTWCDPLAELGWLHVGHRYYDPASGRFVQRDPIGIRGGLNTYAYVRNDPLSGVDPSGLTTPLPNPLEQTPREWWTVGLPGVSRLVPAIMSTSVGTLCVYGGLLSGAATVGWAAGTWIDQYTHSYQDYTWLDRWLAENLFDPYYKRAWGHLPPPRRGRQPIVVCFVEGTVVHTDTGLLPIELIVPGTMLHACDPITGECSSNRVAAVYLGQADVVVHLTIEGERLICTCEHPFWVVERGWVRARSLSIGDRLPAKDGTTVQVQEVSIHTLAQRVSVYNIHVEGYHTYCVGSAGVLVHNKMR